MSLCKGMLLKVKNIFTIQGGGGGLEIFHKNLTFTWFLRRKEERYLDHENFSVALETVLTSHFMYGNESDLLMKCVPTSRMAVMAGEAIPEDHRFLIFIFNPPQVPQDIQWLWAHLPHHPTTQRPTWAFFIKCLMTNFQRRIFWCTFCNT